MCLFLLKKYIFIKIKYIMKNVLVLVLSLIISSSYAQDASLFSMGDIIPEDSEMLEAFVIATEKTPDGGSIFLNVLYNSSDESSVTIDHFDAGMKLQSSTKKEFDKRSKILGCFVKDNEFNMIEFKLEEKTKSFVCYAHTATIGKWQFSKKQLFAIPKKELKKSAYPHNRIVEYQDLYVEKYYLMFNANKTAFAISIELEDSDEGKKQNNLYVFDNSLNLKMEDLYQGDFKYTWYSDMYLSEDGNTLYLLTKEFNRKYYVPYFYEIKQITANGSKSATFNSEDYYVSSLRFANSGNKLFCVGFYANKDNKEYKGVAAFSINPTTLEIETKKFNPIKNPSEADKKEMKNRKIDDIYIKNYLITAQNEIIITGEEYHSSMMERTNFNIHHIEDILVAKLDKDANLIWAKSIDKYQESYAPLGYFSYYSVIKNGNLYLFTSVGEKKENKSSLSFEKNGNWTIGGNHHWNFTLIKITPEGELSSNILVSDGDREVAYYTSFGVYSNDNVFFMGRKKKGKQLVKQAL